MMELIEKLINYLQDNHEWLFSGLGTYVISGIAAVLLAVLTIKIRNKRSLANQKIKSGKKSINIQSGRDTRF